MINKDQDRAGMFTRRAFVLGLMQGTFLTVLGGRLAYLQVIEGSRYQMLSDKNRINLKMLAPMRGQIVDRYGVPLAVNEQNFRVLIIPEQTDDVEKSLRNLQKLVSLDEQDIKLALKKTKGNPSFLPIQIRDQLSWQEVAKIEVNLTDLPGISIDVGELRNYPLGPATAHLVGYVGIVSKSALTGDRVLTRPGLSTGNTGIETAHDIALRGKAGTSEVEVNVAGREVRAPRNTPIKTAQRITPTIDAELQRFVQHRLDQEKSATAVIMDAQTGALYAMASSPSFDPNMFTRGLPADKWEELLSNPAHPLTNKAVAGQYPPGSTFKMITALAALENNIITRNTSVFCTGHYSYGRDGFHCWNSGGHGRVDLIKSLAESCDVFYYKISTEVGIEKISEMARKLGLGQKTGFELSEENPGLIPDKIWKMGHFGKPWQPGETIVTSIGQGYLQATPLQMATMTARMVNGGYAVKPWLTAREPPKDFTWPSMDIKKKNLDLMIRGMNKAVLHPDGTANSSAIPVRNMAMGGKTGTSQVRRITSQERLEGVRNEDLPWKLRHHALFVGFAPVKNPRNACAVVIAHGGSGRATAAPVAREILWEAKKRAPAKSILKGSA